VNAGNEAGQDRGQGSHPEARQMEIEAMPRQSRLCRGKTDGDRGKAEAEAVTPRLGQGRWRSRQGQGRGSHPKAEAMQMEIEARLM